LILTYVVGTVEPKRW